MQYYPLMKFIYEKLVGFKWFRKLIGGRWYLNRYTINFRRNIILIWEQRKYVGGNIETIQEENY